MNQGEELATKYSCNAIREACERYDELEKVYKQATGLGSGEFAAWKDCALKLRDTVERLQVLLGEGNTLAAAPLAYFNTWVQLRPEGFTTC